MLFGALEDRLSYDCQDWLEHFLRQLTKKEELRKLDFHYFFRGEQLERNVMVELKNFTHLQELRFGEHHFSNFNFFHWEKMSFPEVRHLTMPLFQEPDRALRFLTLAPKIVPSLRSLTFEDTGYEKVSCTERCAPQIASLGIQHLRFMVHDFSDKESIADLATHLYPQLESLYMRAVQPQLASHRDMLDSLLKVANPNLRKLKLRCDGMIPASYAIKWPIYSLQHFYALRLTQVYDSLCSFL